MVKFSSNRGGVRNLIVDIDSKEQPDFQNSATIQLSNLTVVPPHTVPDVIVCPAPTVPPYIVPPRDPVVLPPGDVPDGPTHTVPPYTVPDATDCPPSTVPTHKVPPRKFTASGISGKVPHQTRKVPQQTRKDSQQSGKVSQLSDNLFTSFL